MPWYSGYRSGFPMVASRDAALAMGDAYFTYNPQGAVQYFVNQGGGYWVFVRSMWLNHQGEWLLYNYPPTSGAYQQGGQSGSGGGSGYAPVVPPPPPPPPPAPPPAPPPPPPSPFGPPVEIPPPPVDVPPGEIPEEWAPGVDQPQVPIIGGHYRAPRLPDSADTGIIEPVAGAHLGESAMDAIFRQARIQAGSSVYEPGNVVPVAVGQPTYVPDVYRAILSVVQAAPDAKPPIDNPTLFNLIGLPADNVYAAAGIDKCRCQLIVWPSAPGGLRASPAEVEPSLEDGKVPETYKSVVMRVKDLPFNGRFTLIPPTDTGKSTDVGKSWSISAYKKGKLVSDALEFRIWKASGLPEPWQAVLVGEKTQCEAQVEFEFRPISDASPNDPGDPDDYYVIRGQWPSAGGNEAIICEAKVILEGDLCACEISPLRGIGTIPKHLESDDFELGVCISTAASGGGSVYSACPFPETTAATIDKRGLPEKDVDFQLTSRFASSGRATKLKPLELKLLDSQAKPDGSRQQSENPQRGYWSDSRWEKTRRLREPCRTAPLRTLIRINKDRDVRQFIGARLREQINAIAPGHAGLLAAAYMAQGLTYEQANARAWQEAVPWAWKNAEVQTVIQLLRGNDDDAVVLCERKLPIRAKGGLWVFYGPNDPGDFAQAVLDALRRMSGASSDLNWLGGVAPERNEVGIVAPSPGFCAAPPSPTHIKGWELVSRFVCGTCCALIMRGGPDAYLPYSAKDAFPRGVGGLGLDAEGMVKHWTHKTVDCMGKDGPSPLSTGALRDIVGTGMGTGGIVQTQASAQNWRLWPASGGRWVEGRAQPASPARILAHELGHLALGCEGKLMSGVKLRSEHRELIYQYPGTGDAKALKAWVDAIAAEKAAFDSGTATGSLEGLPWSSAWKNFEDLGEYDAIIQWENPIARELGEPPRFAHR